MRSPLAVIALTATALLSSTTAASAAQPPPSPMQVTRVECLAHRAVLLGGHMTRMALTPRPLPARMIATRSMGWTLSLPCPRREGDLQGRVTHK